MNESKPVKKAQTAQEALGATDERDVMATEERTDVTGYNWFQRTFKGVSAGDVFIVPIEAGGFGFGRLLNANDGAIIAEFFRYWAPKPVFHEDILSSWRLFAPIGILADSISYRNRKREWKVIHRDPDFYPNDLYDLPFVRLGGGGKWIYYTLHDINTELGPVSDTDEETYKVGALGPQHPGFIAKLMENKLLTEGLMSQ